MLQYKGATTLSIVTFSLFTLSIVELSITTLSMAIKWDPSITTPNTEFDCT